MQAADIPVDDEDGEGSVGVLDVAAGLSASIFELSADVGVLESPRVESTPTD
jgi:hypothetical protein